MPEFVPPPPQQAKAGITMMARHTEATPCPTWLSFSVRGLKSTYGREMHFNLTGVTFADAPADGRR
jgi:hypothetical protein